MLECWGDTRNLVRRIRRIVEYRNGRLELEVERFAGKVGKILLLDRANAMTEPAARHNARFQYRERFRLSLLRQFPSWSMVELTTEAQLRAFIARPEPVLCVIPATAWMCDGSASSRSSTA